MAKGQLSFRLPERLRTLTPSQREEYRKVKFSKLSDKELWEEYDKAVAHAKDSVQNVHKRCKNMTATQAKNEQRHSMNYASDKTAVSEMILDELADRGDEIAVELQS